MSRTSTVWYWSQKNTYCTTIHGERIPLSKNKQEAVKLFHKLMAEEKKPVTRGLASVLDDFLAWCYENRAPRTADRYKDFCQDFLDHVRDMPVASLTTGHVTDWLTGKKWNATTKRNAITAISRALNWARKNLGIQNPIAGMEKPIPKKRTAVIPPDEFDAIIGSYPEDDPFRDLLIVSYDSGCRPQEIRKLEARHIELEKSRAVIPAEEAKGHIQRAFYFPTDRSMEIIRRLVADRPVGLLFRTARGTPWNRFNVQCRFQRLEKKSGKRYFHYGMRHSAITRQLAAGVDSHTVAKLSGHQNTNQLDRTYSHIADDYEYMLRMAKKGAGT